MDKPPVKKSVVKKTGIGCLGIIVLFFAFIFIMMAVDGWSRYKNGKASMKWPFTQGVILSSQVKTDLGKDKDADPKHTAAIVYQYTVEGYEYSRERISFAGGRTFFKKSKAESLVRRYGKGLRVKVYYDPKTPTVSVLEPGNASVPPIIPLVVVAVIGFFLIRIIRLFYRKRTAVQPTDSPSFTPQASVAKPAEYTSKGEVRLPPGGVAQKNKPDRTLAIFPLVFPLAGIFVLYFGVNALLKGYESRKWPTVNGQISNSYIDRRDETSNGRSSISYAAILGYEYRVNGKNYYCDTIRFGKSKYASRKRSKTLKYLELYPMGKPVTVYYDPVDPHTAVLKTGISGGALLLITVGFFFILVGVISFLSLRNQRGRRNIIGSST
ncbi:MAG: hypothetical protein DRH26_14630 [Deltaproteobacteria bacterium]|nr:MAG: hypothetical protein DRH26_14630 [Deltaproteobacteria bacterium]